MLAPTRRAKISRACSCVSIRSVGMRVTTRAPMASGSETNGIQRCPPAAKVRRAEGSPVQSARVKAGIGNRGSPESMTKPSVVTNSTGAPVNREYCVRKSWT